MLLQQLTLAVLLSLTGHAASERILSGSVAQSGQFPYQVLVICDDTAFCGGALITLQHALTYEGCTYAHLVCTTTVGALTIDGSEPERATRRVTTTHDPFSYLMLLTMEEPVEESANVRPVRLPKRSDVTNMFVDWRGVFAGWGEATNGGGLSNELRFLELAVVDNVRCGLSQMFLCAASVTGGKESSFDYGGGLAIEIDGQWVLIGILHSFSLPDYSSYMRITESLDWISSNTGLVIP